MTKMYIEIKGGVRFVWGWSVIKWYIYIYKHTTKMNKTKDKLKKLI